MKNMTSHHWTEDLNFISTELPKNHKNLFFHRKKEDFYNDIEKLKKTISAWDDYELQVQIAKIISSIGDAHTSLNLQVFLFCPFECYWFADGIYIISTIPKYAHMLYCKILKINGINIEDVITTVSSVVSHENEFFLKSQLPKFLPAVDILYGLEILDDIDKIELTLQHQNGNISEARIYSLPVKEAKALLTKITPVKAMQSALPLYRKHSNQNYWTEYIPKLKTIYFKYNSCKDMLQKDINTFCEELIPLLYEDEVDKLIIDFRNNLGGNSTLLDPFINKLKTIEKINKKDKLYVIVGRETFSSALLNLLSLKKKTNATFLGEPSGGKPNCYGEVNRISLPNSKLVLCYSTEYYEVIEDDTQMAFTPDVHLELTIQDFLENIDPCMDYIASKNIIF